MVSPYYYCLCLNEASFHREMARLKVPRKDWPSFLTTEHANATTHFLAKADGKRCAIVTLGDSKGRSVPQVHSLLVHEAVHLWQWIRRDIGETEPSVEFEAYSIQSLAQRLMESLEKQTRPK